MTNEMFWNLNDNGKINVKIFTISKATRTVEVDAFEYCGKYYLRIVTDGNPYVLDRTAECGKKYRMQYHNCTIKEFNNRNSANKYYIAVKNNND